MIKVNVFELTFGDVVVQTEHGLLQVVNGCEGASAPDSRTAVKHDFVVVGNVELLLLVERALAPSLAPVMLLQMLNYGAYYLVVLFFGHTEIRPGQVL